MPHRQVGVLTKIFEPSYRLEAAKEVSSEGMGLRLYVTRAIVQAHGGRIQGWSEPGKGTRLTVSLPLRRAHSP